MKYTQSSLSVLGLLLFLLPACVSSPESQAPVDEAARAMVVSANHLASDIGRQIMLDGGNAIDAAIATGFALAVTHPQAGNIGGGGFMVVRFPDGNATTFDFREMAPAASSPGMFLDSSGKYSPTIHHSSHVAVGVPGTVAGFAMIHERHGSLPWRDLLEPAIRLATDGFTVSRRLSDSLKTVLAGRMKDYPASIAAFSDRGRPYEAGETLRQPELAATLRRIQEQGAAGFYRGKTADLIVAEMRKGGGLITHADLEGYAAKERPPIRGTFRGFEVIGMPPPSSGGCCIVQMLNVLETFPLASLGHNSPAYVHLLSETMRRAFRDRAQHLADNDFVPVPVSRLTDKRYAMKIQDELPLTFAGKSEPSQITEKPESDETTHFSVVGPDGTGIAVTYTLEYSYGSGIVVPGAGFILNNEMGDFNAESGNTNAQGLIGTRPNLAAPGKRMLSSMSPTILVRHGRLYAVLGSPGGRTIINTVLQVALNLMVFDMPVQDAVEVARFHHQWLPDQIRMEKKGLSYELADVLKKMGHAIVPVRIQGMAHCIHVDPFTGQATGAADPRDADAGASGF